MTHWSQQQEPIAVMAPSSSQLPFGRASSPALPFQFGFGALAAGPSKPATPPPSRRRRRESTPLEEDRAGGDAMDVVGALTNKRARRDYKGLRGPSATSRTSPEVSPADIDLGKSLASLPKESLLSIITSLMGQHPGLRPVIQTLIPPPSLEAFTSALAQLEKAVIERIPRGLNLRDEYVWNRVRGPLDSYVTEGRSFIAAFVPSTTGVATNAAEDAAHPTTTFTFLLSLTASLQRVEAALPRPPPASSASLGTAYRVAPSDPLSSHLVPQLFNAWHTFVTRLAASVNEQGRILSAGTLRTWFRSLDELCAANVGGNEVPTRRACEGIRERLVKELGWTIGLRQRASLSSSPTLRGDDAMFDDEEEL